MYIGKMKQPHAPFQAVLDRTSFDLKAAGFTYDRNYDHFEDQLFEKAYLARLRRASTKAGFGDGVSVRALSDVRERVGKVVAKRKRAMAAVMCPSESRPMY